MLQLMTTSTEVPAREAFSRQSNAAAVARL